MKHFGTSRIGIAVLTALLVLVSCEKEATDELEFNEGGLKAIEVVSSFVDEIPEDVCLTKHYDLVAGQDIPVGSVEVANNATHVYVKYCVSGEYLLSETHLYVGDIANLPINKKGNPVIGHFPYSWEDTLGQKCVIHEIPIGMILDNNGSFDIAAHAVVINEAGTFDETAWGKAGPAEENVVFVIKSRLVDGGQDCWGINYGDTISPGCTWASYAQYTEINLNSFSSETFDLYNYTTGDKVGEAFVEYSAGNLDFTISSFNSDVVKMSYLFVGTMEELDDILSGLQRCANFQDYPYQDLVASSAHFFSANVGIPQSLIDEGLELGSTRWGFYIGNYHLCI